METGITRDRIWKRYNKGCTNEEIFKEYIDNGYKPIIRKEIYKKKITFMGETKSIYEWERITNIPSDIIKRRFIENLPVE